MSFRINKTNFFCFIGVLLFLTALYFGQQWVVPTTLPLGFSEKGRAVGEQFPLDERLEIYTDSGQRNSTSLREVLKGHEKVIINFWATWCPPCIDELPSLEYLNRQIQRSRKFSKTLVIAISVDETQQAIRNLFKTLEFPISISVLRDQEGRIATSVGTTKFPETYLVNSQGYILHKWIGPQNWLGPDVIRIIQN